ncbi:uncharacterized protein MELLADRAFT_92258 [Melampsora larici-populina 98AG31]|uniref:Uncharacterized protein n=1 Tax=Melampsora larici-populina (strain 98AG31 / pathotype 3-4-7) TaxID=747676 RepID=F4R8Z5_MELLP|nr:uncharacterized protein MELLADRAFT_92258 [Melampsora larici-populina 98AG31]EGG11244.1 hypothetical protein MELLADRAFT_92258 [Melampsora larici-populina 98AG31]
MNQECALPYSNGAYLSDPPRVLDAMYSQFEHPVQGNISPNLVARPSFCNPRIFSEISPNVIAQPPLNTSIHSGSTPNLDISSSFTTGAVYSTQPPNLSVPLASYNASICPVQSSSPNVQLYPSNSGIFSYQSPNLIGQPTSHSATAYSEPSPNLNVPSPLCSASTYSQLSPNLNVPFSPYDAGINSYPSPNPSVQSSYHPGFAYSNQCRQTIHKMQYFLNWSTNVRFMITNQPVLSSKPTSSIILVQCWHKSVPITKIECKGLIRIECSKNGHQIRIFNLLTIPELYIRTNYQISNHPRGPIMALYIQENVSNTTNLIKGQPLVNPHQEFHPNLNQDHELQPQQVCNQLLEMFGYNSISTLPMEGVLPQPLQLDIKDLSVYGSIQGPNTTLGETVNTPAQCIQPDWYILPQSSTVYHNESVSFPEQNLTISQQVYESPAQLEAYNTITAGVPIEERCSQIIPSGSEAIDDPVVPKKKSRTRKPPVKKSKPSNNQPTASSLSNGGLSNTQQVPLAQINSPFGLLDAYDTLHGCMNTNTNSATSEEAVNETFASGSEMIQAPIASGSMMKAPTPPNEKMHGFVYQGFDSNLDLAIALIRVARTWLQF